MPRITATMRITNKKFEANEFEAPSGNQTRDKKYMTTEAVMAMLM
jgi:hypothetical protein